MVVFLLCCIYMNMAGQRSIYLEILPGFAHAFPSNLKIHQEGYSDIEFLARYKVKPFTLPIYYSYRAGLSLNKSLSFEIELNHLKLYLVNKPDEIQQFSVSHGYNQVWFSLIKEFRFFHVRGGMGPVIAHPENTVRGNTLSGTGGLFDNGYFLDGITSQLAVQKRMYLLKNVYLSAEAKLNASFSRTNVVDGYANISVFAFHALLGAGVSF